MIMKPDFSEMFGDFSQREYLIIRSVCILKTVAKRVKAQKLIFVTAEPNTLLIKNNSGIKYITEIVVNKAEMKEATFV